MIKSTGLEQSMVNMQEGKISILSGKDLSNAKKEELMAAAQQFEAVFINQLFKAMDSTVQKDGMFTGGRGEEMFKSMFYDEIAKDISSSPNTSFGFAKQIYEQMQDMV